MLYLVSRADVQYHLVSTALFLVSYWEKVGGGGGVVEQTNRFTRLKWHMRPPIGWI